MAQEMIEQLHAEDIENARRLFAQNKGLPPIFMIRTGTEFHVVQVDTSDSQKDHAYNVVRLMCIAHDAMALAIVAEAWVAAARPEDEAAIRATGAMARRPSQREDRWEALTIVTALRGHDRVEYRHTAIRIEQHEAGPPTLGDVESSSEASGALVTIFPHRKPTAEERRQANELLARLKVSGGLKHIPTLH